MVWIGDPREPEWTPTTHHTEMPFISWRHREIFGTLFPLHFRNWFTDTWLWSVYAAPFGDGGPSLVRPSSVMVEHAHTGQKYDIDRSWAWGGHNEPLWPDVVEEGRRLIRRALSGPIEGGSPPPPPNAYPQFIVVSYADSRYFRCMRNFVASVQWWDPRARIVLYDLGLSDDERRTAATWDQVEEVRTLDWDQLPPHVRHAENYAFKAVVAWDAVARARPGDFVFMEDAGQEMRRPFRAEIGAILARDHIFTTTTQGNFTNGQLTHPDTLAWIEHDLQQHAPADWMAFVTNHTSPSQGGSPHEWLRNQYHRAATIFGVVAGSRWVDQLLRPWLRCCLEPACVMPPGSSLWNHRYDQSALSALLDILGNRDQQWAIRFWSWLEMPDIDRVVSTDPRRLSPDVIMLSRRCRYLAGYPSYDDEGLLRLRKE